MAKPLLPDGLWKRIEPLLPPPKPRRFRFPGRKPLEDHKCLIGILFVLKTGIAWDDLPIEMGCGSGMTCWRRLRDWTEAGVWSELQRRLLAELQGADRIDWSRAAVDSAHARALGGGEATGPSPVDRGRSGSKHHAVVDGGGVPLAATTTGGYVPDVSELEAVVDAIPPVRGRRGRPRRRPRQLFGDRAYDSDPHRQRMRRRGIRPRFARRNTEHGSGLGKFRWVVERTLGRFHRFGRLRLRTDRTPAIHQAFLTLASCLICFRILMSQPFC